MQDTKGLEKLQLDGDLSLEKAVRTACQSEAVKKQQKCLQSPFQEKTYSIREKELLYSQREDHHQGRKIYAGEEDDSTDSEEAAGEARNYTDARSHPKDSCGRCGRVPAHSRSTVKQEMPSVAT